MAENRGFRSHSHPSINEGEWSPAFVCFSRVGETRLSFRCTRSPGEKIMTTNADAPFVLFGTDHVLTMLIIVLVSIALPMAMRQAGPGNLERSVAGVLAAALGGHELFKIWGRVYLYGEPLVQHLPLHLCSAATFLTAYVLVQRCYSSYEIVYFRGDTKWSSVTTSRLPHRIWGSIRGWGSSGRRSLPILVKNASSPA